MKVDVFHARKVPFEYISPAVCDFVFSASGKTEIFLTNKGATGVIGLTYDYIGNTIRLQWDTYPGALCYSVYKLVDELDPYSTWRLIAECITDTFLDVTDPGAYAVTPVTPEGEGTIPDPTIVPPYIGPGACSGNQPPVGIGIEADVCENTATDIDVSGANTDPEGYPLEIVTASVDNGSVSFAGLVLAYTPPTDFYGDALINYSVVDPCGATADNAVLVHVWDEPEFDAIDETTCDDTPIDIDILDYLNVNDTQTWLVSDASVDVGGSVSFTGTTITFTPTPAFAGPVELTFSVIGNCGTEYEGTGDITVECGVCDMFDAAGAWTDNSQAACAAVSGVATFSGLNNTATASASSVDYVGDILGDHIECVAPLSSIAGGVIQINWDEEDDRDCRITMDVSGSGGYYFAYYFVYWDTDVLNTQIAHGETWSTETITEDFVMPGVPAGFPRHPVKVEIYFYAYGGQLDTGPCFPCGWIGGDVTATLTIGPQP